MNTVGADIKKLGTKLADNHGIGSFESAEPIIHRGEVNQVYELKTDKQKAILRINTIAEIERFDKEQWCIEAARAIGVITPGVIAVGKDKDIAYLLMEFVEGKNGKDILPTPALWQALGQQLRLIHSVPVKGFGERLHDITEGDATSWQRFLNYNISSLGVNDELITRGIIHSATSQKLCVIFEKLAATDFQFGLNHGDLSLANVIVNTHDEPSIIDWGSARAHVAPHHDFGVILDESVKEASAEFAALLKGYGMSLQEYYKIKDTIAALYLLEVTDKLRWAIENAPHRINHYSHMVKKYLPIIKRWQ